MPTARVEKLKATAYDAAISITTSTTFQNKITLGPIVPTRTGTYQIRATYGWNHDDNGSDFEGRIMQNAVQIGELHKQEPKDNAGGDPTGSLQRYYVSRAQEIALTAGVSYTWDLEYRTDSAGVESAIWEAQLELTQVF